MKSIWGREGGRVAVLAVAEAIRPACSVVY